MAVMSVDYIGGMDNLYAAMDPAATGFLAIDKLGLLPAVSLAVVIGVGGTGGAFIPSAYLLG